MTPIQTARALRQRGLSEIEAGTLVAHLEGIHTPIDLDPVSWTPTEVARLLFQRHRLGLDPRTDGGEGTESRGWTDPNG